MIASYERREAPRIPCGFEIDDVTGVQSIACRATNISETGTYVRLRGGVLLEGERVALAVHLPDADEPLWVSGQVVEQVQETLHDGAAIQFDRLSSGDQARLRAYVGRTRQGLLGQALAGASGLASGA